MAEIEERALRGRIKKARKEAGLTQGKLAALLDVGQRAYQNYEDAGPNGVTPWRLINAIAKATNTAPEWLLHGDPVDNDQLNRMEKNLAEVSRRVDELREMLRTGAAVAGDERRVVPPPPKGLQPVEPGSGRTQEDPPESVTEAEDTD